ncbi:MAG: phage capsid protein [Chloroflexota bacterium]|nr:phage capsid protein [Chloroflexota bacterium]
MANTFEKSQKWASVLQSQLRESFIGKMIVSTKFEGDFTGSDTVNFRRQAKITTLPLATASSSVTIQALTESNETFTLNTRKHFAIEIADEDAKELDISPESQAIQDAVEQYGRDYDTAIMQEYANAGITVDDGDLETATNGGTGNSATLSKTNIYDLFTAINEKLDLANVPNSNRWIIISPSERRLLMKSPDLVKATDFGDKVVTGGKVGELQGIKIYFSNNIQTATGVKHLLAGQGKPVDFAANLKPAVQIIPSSSNPDKFVSIFKSFTKFGTKVFTNGSEKLIDVQITA